MPVSDNSLSTGAKWVGRADCRNCARRSGTLFGALTNKEAEELPPVIDQYEFSPNHCIYEAGEESEFIYTIRDGFVKAIAHTADGTQRIVRLYKSGDVIGLESLIDKSYQHTLIAMGTVNACKVPVKIIKRLLRKSPKLSERLMRQWQTGVERADYWLMRLTAGTVESRVSWLLKILVEFDSSEEKSIIKLPATSEIAAIIDATVESASRVVAKLKRKSVLNKVKPHIYKCDFGKLSF